MNNKFQYSCIGDNTPENREHLEKLGYDKLGAIRGKKYLVTDDGFYYASMVAVGYPVINCIGNPALFQAVTALREDSDYMQWFIFDKKSFVGDTLIGFKGEWLIVKDHNILFDKRTYVHKATLAELEEHFKI